MLAEVRDDTREGEDELVGTRAVILDDFAVDPSAQAQGVRGRLGGGDELGTQRGIAVAALRAHIRPLVRGLHVVEAEVVRRGHAGHIRPGVSLGDVAGGGADDDGDLTFESEQRGACGAFDGLPGGGDGAGRFEEVGRLSGAFASLRGTGLICHMNGNDLARTGGNTCWSRHRSHTSFRLASPQIVYDTVPENK